MGYIEGTLTSANPAADLATIIKDEMVLEGGVFVETYVDGSSTVQVIEIPEVASPLNQKWYLFLAYATASGTTLNMTASEGWQTSGKNLVRGVINGGSSTFTLDATTGSMWGNTGQTRSYWLQWQLTLRTTVFRYNFVVNGASVVGGVDSSGSAGYVGQMQPSPVVKAGNDAKDGYYPLVLLPSHNVTTCSTSRIFGGLSGSQAWGSRVANRCLNSSASRSLRVGMIDTTAAVRFAVGPDEGSAVGIPNHMGSLYNCLFFRVSDGASGGDRVICDGNYWAFPYCSGGLNNSPFLLKVGPV